MLRRRRCPPHRLRSRHGQCRARAAKASARDALPEATKVTVVQQETHLPPARSSARPQQVANAVVVRAEGVGRTNGLHRADLAGVARHCARAAEDTDRSISSLRRSVMSPCAFVSSARRCPSTSRPSARTPSQMLDQQRDSIRDLMQSARLCRRGRARPARLAGRIPERLRPVAAAAFGPAAAAVAVARHVRRRRHVVGAIGRRSEAGPAGAPAQPGDAS